MMKSVCYCLLLLSLLIVENSGVKCRKNKDCPGYSRFGRTRCCNNKCVRKTSIFHSCPVDKNKKFHKFICPDGKSFSMNKFSIQNLKLQIFEKCTVNADELCPSWPSAWKRNENGCSLPKFLGQPGKDLGRNFYGACLIHDFCYGTPGMSRKNCDFWFKQNIESTCDAMMVGEPFSKLIAWKCKKMLGLLHSVMKVIGKKAFRWKKLWRDKNCFINKKNRFYATIQSAVSNQYLLACSKKDVFVPTLRKGAKALQYYGIDTCDQFIFEDADVEYSYYIRSYIGAYLKCDGNELEHTIGKNSNAIFTLVACGRGSKINCVRLKSRKTKKYIYITHDGDLGCTRYSSNKRTKWKIVSIKSPGPKLFNEAGRQVTQ